MENFEIFQHIWLRHQGLVEKACGPIESYPDVQWLFYLSFQRSILFFLHQALLIRSFLGKKQ